MLNMYMKGVKVLMMREGEKTICGIGKEKKKGKKDKRPENIE